MFYRVAPASPAIANGYADNNTELREETKEWGTAYTMPIVPLATTAT